GGVKTIRRFAPDATVCHPMNPVSCGPDAIRYVGQDGGDFRVHLTLRSNGSDPTAPWLRKVDPTRAMEGDNSLAIRWESPQVYLIDNEHVLRFDTGTKQEIDYALPGAAAAAVPPATPPIGPPASRILDCRTIGDRMLVVSGNTGTPPGQPAGPEDVQRSKIYVDVFQFGTGKHVSRQELPSIAYRDDLTQSLLLPTAIIVTDLAGVHAFGMP
ncbi:MAG: hypothetical protein K8T25_10665, partial [Planctomycetia bacterium]|nr:hypothetical protein [Planctomycetia bacterium]